MKEEMVMPMGSLEGFKLSPAQKHLWDLQKYLGKQTFRVEAAVLIEGRLDTVFLKAALQKTIFRHEILRTFFMSHGGRPVQVVGDATLNFEIERHAEGDVSRDEKIRKLFARFQAVPTFHEGVLPLRLSLINLDPEAHALLFGLPALCGDSQTLHHFFRELGTAYESCADNKALSDEPTQYGEYVGWQNGILEKDGEEGRRYWLRHPIRDCRGPDAFEKFEPRFIACDLDPSHLEKLPHRVQGQLPIASLYLGAWQLLMSRLAGNEKVFVGRAVDGRKYPELKTALGPYSRYLPLAAAADERSVLAWVQELDQQCGEAAAWLEFFNWDSVEPADRLHCLPALFDYHDLPEPFRAGDVRFTLLHSYSCLEPFTWRLEMRRQDRNLTAQLHYNAAQNSAHDAELMLERLQTVHRDIALDPKKRSASVNVLGPEERQRR